MLSIHVKTMAASALELQKYLESFGIKTWVCTQMQGGTNYRDEIVSCVRQCYAFVPLINDEWGASGECEDEFSLAKRRNLTSYEMKTAVAPQPRRPVIVPIAFPNLTWSKYSHVELLASKTNFIVHPAETFTATNKDATFHQTLESIFNSLHAFGVKLSEENTTKILATIGKQAVGDLAGKTSALASAKGSSEDVAESLAFYLQKSLEVHRQLTTLLKRQAQQDKQDDELPEYELKKRYFGTSVKSFHFHELGIEQRSWFSGELGFTLGDATGTTGTMHKLEATISWVNLRQLVTPSDARSKSPEVWAKIPDAVRGIMEFLGGCVGTKWVWKLDGTFDKATGEIELKVQSVPDIPIFSNTSITKFLVSKAGDKLEGYFFDSPDSFRGQGSFRFAAF